MAFLRIWSLAAFCAGLWLLASHGQYRPAPVSADAPVQAFSAVRASAALARVLGPQTPHPAGSAQNAAVRMRLLEVLATMGVDAHTRPAMSCYSQPRWHVVSCGTVSNVIAQVVPGAGDPVLLMAHLDSVAAGPGACDDGCGVATLLETIRALKAAGFKGAHPIVALFTDGEEDGLLGAAAFLRDGAIRPMAVINVEARGNQGPSYLFQTSAGDAPLIDLYARSVTHYATSSLYGEIYKYLPNDTDLTPFLQAGIPGYNFALIGNVGAYHTTLDVRAGIDLSGLQQHGEAALRLARALSDSKPATLIGSKAIYLDVLGRWLPRLPVSWAPPLAIAAFVLVVLAGLLRRRHYRVPEHALSAFFMPPLLVAGAVAMGFGLHALAAWIAGSGDPSFAHPVWLRLALGFGVWAVALLAAPRAGAISAWGWIAGLGVAAAFLAPGLSPYFLFPALVGAPLLLASVRYGRGPALLVSAIVGLVIWLQLNAGTEPLMGLKVHPIFTVTAALALVPVLPLLAPARGGARIASVAIALAMALGMAVTAGLMDAHTAAAPERMNITYLENNGEAAWLVDSPSPPGPAMRAAAGAPFGATPVGVTGLGLFGYVAPSQTANLAVPQAHVSAGRSGRMVLTLQGSDAADAMMLHIPARAHLTAVSVNGVRMVASGDTLIVCHTPDCARARIILEGSFDGVLARLAEIRSGLPPKATALVKARPDWARPWGAGDRTVVGTTVELAQSR